MKVLVKFNSNAKFFTKYLRVEGVGTTAMIFHY